MVVGVEKSRGPVARLDYSISRTIQKWLHFYTRYFEMIPNLFGHHQTTRPPHEYYCLFNAWIAGIFGSTLCLHVGNGMAALCSGLDALFENKRKVTEGNTAF